MGTISNKWLIFLVMCVFLFISLACGSSTPDTGTLVSTNEPISEVNTQETGEIESEESVEIEQKESESSPTSTTQTNSNAPVVYKVGDVIEVSDQRVMVVSTEFQANELLKVEFLIENTGSDSVAISSLMSFSAKSPDGVKLDQEYFDCGNSLDGEVLSGDKLRGDLCWKNAVPGTKVYYEPKLFGSTTIVWKFDESAESEVSQTDNADSLQKYQIGDTVHIQDHQISLTAVEYVDNKLQATFLIENLGQDVVTVSSMISFSAKSLEGVKLEQDYFDCGPSLDGRVLSGDRMKGSVCWEGAQPPNTIYYDASLFGSGMIVWEVTETMAAEVAASLESDKVDSYRVGEAVSIDDHQITLVETKLQGAVLKATFLIENSGSETIDISSMLNFYARNRDGTALEQEYFDCGSSMDGSIIPGDKLKGDICWEIPGEAYKIYYTASVLGDNILVWRIE